MLNNSVEKQSCFAKIFFIFSFFFVTQLFFAEIAVSAKQTDELTCTMVRIVEALKGPMGKAIATIAIIALGIGLFMGKLSWGLAVATALGIAMIFGAGSIVEWLSGGQFGKEAVQDCTNTNGTV